MLITPPLRLRKGRNDAKTVRLLRISWSYLVRKILNNDWAYDAGREVAIDVRCKREDVRWIKKHVG